MYIGKTKASADASAVTGNLAEGIRVPTTVERPDDFLLNRVKDYNIMRDPASIRGLMDLCEKLYRFEGTCGTAIDIFVDFAITKIRAEETGKKDLDKALKFFNEQVNADVTSTIRGMQSILQKVALDWFIKGNAFPYTSWDEVDVPEVSAPVKLPVRIVCLNPGLISIPLEKMLLGDAQLYYNPTQEMISLLNEDGRSNPGLKKLKDMFRGNKQDGLYGYKLDKRFVKHIKRKGTDYNPWGVPYLTKAFSAVASIRRLRRLDDATTEGLVNLVTIYKIGDKDFPAGPGRLAAFRNLINNPTPTQTLVWPHDVSVEQTGPDGKILAFDKKYVEPRQELLRALGVPAILIDPNLAKGGDQWATVIALAERLQKFRDEIEIYVEDLYYQIAKANGYPDVYPKARWQRMNLSNDQAIKNFVMQFYDRGLIDPQTALEESNYDFNTVFNRKKANKGGEVEKLFVPPQLPFGGTPAEKGRPTKNSPQDKPKDKTKKPAVDMQTQRKPAKPKTTKVAASEDIEP